MYSSDDQTAISGKDLRKAFSLSLSPAFHEHVKRQSNEAGFPISKYLEQTLWPVLIQKDADKEEMQIRLQEALMVYKAELDKKAIFISADAMSILKSKKKTENINALASSLIIKGAKSVDTRNVPMYPPGYKHPDHKAKPMIKPKVDMDFLMS